MKRENTEQHSLTENRTDISGYKVVAELPSFRHAVLRVSDVNGNILYVKQYIDDDSFYNESHILSIDSLANQPFTAPRITHQHLEERVNILTEVKGLPLDLETTDYPLIRRLAGHLRRFHDEVHSSELKPIDYLEQLRTFEQRITDSDHVSVDNKSMVADALSSVKFFFQKGVPSKVVVHGDFNHSNVLYNPSNQRLGLIDFERTGLGYRSTDISRLAWRILNNDPDKTKVLLEEYYHTDSISPEQLQEFLALQAYDSIGAVAYYAMEGYKKGYPYYFGAIQNLKSLQPIL